ncbi:MAG: FAD:protein FMN transferase [Oscillospiraceae bacterium]|nr:FAD:protein FMN transferase [Oscillospiraceae bacterium]
MKLILTVIFVLVCVAAVVIGNNNSGAEISQTEFLMDTMATIRIHGRGNSARDAINAAFAEAWEIKRITDYFDENSEVSAINRAAAGERIAISPHLFEILTIARGISELSDGAFDITVASVMDLWDFRGEPRVPRENELAVLLPFVDFRGITLHADGTVSKAADEIRIDLGSIAKGYAADIAAEVLRERGARWGIVDFGGDIVVFGNRAFNIGLQRAFAPRGEYWKVVESRNSAIVTSGIYERYFIEGLQIYHHIIDPWTGRPARSKECCPSELYAVSVVGSTAARADAVATAVFVMTARGYSEEQLRELFSEYDIYFEFEGR